MSVQIKGSGTIGGIDEGLNITGVCTATSFSGTASGNATISNNADNRVITGGSGNALNGESGVTYDGTNFTVSSGKIKLTDESSGSQLSIGASGDFAIEHDSNHTYLGNITGDVVIQNDANVKITAKSGGTERFRFTSGGQLNIGGDFTQSTYDLSVTHASNFLRLKDSNEGNYDLRFMIQNGEANIWHYGTDDLTFGARYDRKVHLLTNGSKRLTVNGDLVGINNTSPSKNLHVTASSVATVRIETLDSRGQAWDLLSTNGAGTNTGTLSFRNEAGSSYLDLAANGGSPKTTFRNGGANDLLVIDNNGNVTKPRNPLFVAQKSGAITGTGFVTFNTVIENVGSHYDSSNGRFTAPVAGYYWFCCKINAYKRIDFFFKRNGSNSGAANREIGQFNTSNQDGWYSHNLIRVFELSANDYVQVDVTNIYQNSDPGEWITFQGYLLQ